MADSLVAVIGSATRAYTLAILAGSRLPLTAYRIAKLAGLSPPNVYVELRKLARANIVTKGSAGWTLTDERVRTFCEGKGPLFERRLSLEEKRRWSRENRRTYSRLRRMPIPIGEGWTGPEPKLMREFSRSRTKNELLRAAGLRASEHKKR
jgi:DNA-binding transcriptional ArsR family regulator